MHKFLNQPRNPPTVFKSSLKEEVIADDAQIKIILVFLLLCRLLHAGLETYPLPPNAVESSVFSLTVDGSARRHLSKQCPAGG